MKGQQVKQMLLEGNSYSTISATLNVAISTVAYHAERIGRKKYSLIRKEHNWKEIQDFYNAGYTINAIREFFHIDRETLDKAKERGDILFYKRSRHDITKMLVQDSIHTTSVVRRIIRRENLIPYHCHSKNCILHDKLEPIWSRDPLVLHLDHINGKRNDHRLENLHWLCPNCHSQTETYCGRNKIGDGCG